LTTAQLQLVPDYNCAAVLAVIVIVLRDSADAK